MPSDYSRMGTQRALSVVLDNLKRVASECDEARHRARRSGRQFAGGSVAESDTLALGTAEEIETLLAFVSLQISAGLDHVAALIAMGEDALHRRPVAAYASHSIARSALECFGSAAWLCEPGISSVVRAGRSLSFLFRDLDAQRRLRVLTDDDAIRAVEERAATLNLPLTRGRRDTRGFGATFPSLSERVKLIVADDDVYPMLSAAAHGDVWAIAALGYHETGDANRVELKKAPPMYGLVFALQLPLAGVVEATIAEATYSGLARVEIGKAVRWVRNVPERLQLSRPSAPSPPVR